MPVWMAAVKPRIYRSRLGWTLSIPCKGVPVLGVYRADFPPPKFQYLTGGSFKEVVSWLPKVWAYLA